MAGTTQPRAVRSAALMTVGVMLFGPFPLIPRLWGVSLLWAATLVEAGSGLVVVAAAGRRSWWPAVGRQIPTRDFVGCVLGRATTLPVIFAAPGVSQRPVSAPLRRTDMTGCPQLLCADASCGRRRDVPTHQAGMTRWRPRARAPSWSGRG